MRTCDSCGRETWELYAVSSGHGGSESLLCVDCLAAWREDDAVEAGQAEADERD